jgi:rRNA maturation endonuclease Nob1
MDSKSDFAWVQNIGTKLFERVEFTVGENILDSYNYCKKCEDLTKCIQTYDKKSEFCGNCGHLC